MINFYWKNSWERLFHWCNSASKADTRKNSVKNLIGRIYDFTKIYLNRFNANRDVKHKRNFNSLFLKQHETSKKIWIDLTCPWYFTKWTSMNLHKDTTHLLTKETKHFIDIYLGNIGHFLPTNPLWTSWDSSYMIMCLKSWRLKNTPICKNKV